MRVLCEKSVRINESSAAETASPSRRHGMMTQNYRYLARRSWVRVALKLNVGDTVAIESQSNLAFGIVRHCRQVNGNTARIYRAGLQVYDVLSKSETPTKANQRWISSILRRRTGGGAQIRE